MRPQSRVEILLSTALMRLQELKELQLFGGDAINMQVYEHTVTIPDDAVPHCWRIVITPTAPETTLPINITATPAVDGQASTTASIERVRRTDGNYEFLVIYGANYGNTKTDKITITYTGKATFSVQQIG